MTRFLPVASSLSLFIVTSAYGGNIPVPPDLDPGNPYHLVFVSSVGRNATSSEIGHYDSHVQQAANAAGIGVTEGVTWYAIGSTESVDARDHAVVSAPVYNMQMDKLADDYADMWCGVLNNPVKYDENGMEVDVGEWVWTGSGPFGVVDPFGPLGGYNQQVTIGNSRSSVNAWLLIGYEQFGSINRVYGLSSRLTVIPEPEGDFDGDDDVDGADFLAWQRGESHHPFSQLDLDNWQENFGTVASSVAITSTGVPEPTAGILLMLGMMALIAGRRAAVSKPVR